ncbi:hypothetical protein OG389_35590 [Streptomyces sp. NBC_00435]|uniref:hypothetical protein n=1 Tax=Streptomyces sp. NBC_00435 TaxID=2903649 RepID=UPI002E2087A3
MKAKRVQQVLQVVAPFLTEGEATEVATFANVGTVSARRLVGTTVLVGVATAGMVTAVARPRPLYVALTTHRLMFFDANGLTGRPEAKPVMELQREWVAVARVKKFLLALNVHLQVLDSDKELKLSFPRTTHDAARTVVAGLPMVEAPADLSQG